MTQPFLYSVERKFSAPISDVWSAWTEEVQLESWYHGLTMDSVKGVTISDAKVGGTWAVAIDVAAHDFVAYFYGAYLAIETNSRIEHTMHYTESTTEFEIKDMTTPSHLVVVEFEDRTAKTWVKFSQYGELSTGEATQAQAGMESYFDSLENFLASQK